MKTYQKTVGIILSCYVYSMHTFASCVLIALVTISLNPSSVLPSTLKYHFFVCSRLLTLSIIVCKHSVLISVRIAFSLFSAISNSLTSISSCSFHITMFFKNDADTARFVVTIVWRVLKTPVSCPISLAYKTLFSIHPYHLPLTRKNSQGYILA